MTTVLVLYGTGEGQTAKVADRLVDALDERGHAATAVDAAADPAGLDVDDYDAVLVGASVHAGAHQRAVRSFVTEHRESLSNRPTGFFQVCLSSARSDEEGESQAAAYVDEFIEKTGWHPDRIGMFGGALRYSEYGFVKRAVMKQIAKRSSGDTDTSRDYEYTDWDEVDRFAADFAVFVEASLEADDATEDSEANP